MRVLYIYIYIYAERPAEQQFKRLELHATENERLLAAARAPQPLSSSSNPSVQANVTSPPLAPARAAQSGVRAHLLLKTPSLPRTLRLINMLYLLKNSQRFIKQV